MRIPVRLGLLLCACAIASSAQTEKQHWKPDGKHICGRTIHGLFFQSQLASFPQQFQSGVLEVMRLLFSKEDFDPATLTHSLLLLKLPTASEEPDAYLVYWSNGYSTAPIWFLRVATGGVYSVVADSDTARGAPGDPGGTIGTGFAAAFQDDRSISEQDLILMRKGFYEGGGAKTDFDCLHYGDSQFQLVPCPATCDPEYNQGKYE